jgi:hypothetical protein
VESDQPGSYEGMGDGLIRSDPPLQFNPTFNERES